MMKLLRTRWGGGLKGIALAPWAVMGIGVFILIIIMCLFVGLERLVVLVDAFSGARMASINSDVYQVQNLIYDQVTSLLPAQSSGMTLFTLSDVQINQQDGPWVTTSLHYIIMPPGAGVFAQLGIDPASMTIDVSNTFSFYRDFHQ